MNHQLHAATLIEEAFEDDLLLSRQQADGRLLCSRIENSLLSSGRSAGGFLDQPRFGRGRVYQAGRKFVPQA